MNLIVDIGNSVLKAAMCDGITLGKTFRYQGEHRTDYIVDIIRNNHPAVVLVCSAANLHQSDIEALGGENVKLLIMDPSHREISSSAGIPDYVTPSSVASIIAVSNLFKGKACSIFDFGTMITMSFVDSEGHFTGENISPGCTTRFKSISRYARNLPLLSETDDIERTGTSLNSSVRSGVVSGIMFEVEGYMSLFPDNVAVFTGGDAFYFAKRTKKAIFAISNLVLVGLALILNGYETEH